MTQDVNYTGLQERPSADVSPDGSLTVCHNLINEDRALKPLALPAPLFGLADNEELLFVHSVPGSRANCILRRGNSLYWLEHHDGDTDTSEAEPISGIPELDIADIAAVGNTLILACADGLHYILWREGSYRYLGQRPPFVPIEFSLACSGNRGSSSEKKVQIPAVCHPVYQDIPDDESKAHYARYSEVVFGFLNPLVADHQADGYFHQPFFVRYAFRLYDGSYAWHSAPVLMLPTVLPPVIVCKPKDAAVSGKPDNLTTVTLRTAWFRWCRLLHAILIPEQDRQQLQQWSDIISGIDIFVTAPIYTYDQGSDLEKPPTTLRAFIYNFKKDAAEQEEQESAFQPDAQADNSTGSGTASGTPDPGNGDDGSSDADADDDNDNDSPAIGTGRDNDGLDTFLSDKDGVFFGHYSYQENAARDYYLNRSYYYDASGYVVDMRLHSHFVNNLQSAHEFYKIASLEFDKIKSFYPLEELKLDDKDLRSLVNKPRLPDDFRSHCPLHASLLYSFNSRINLAGIELAPAAPFPIRSIMACGDFGEKRNVRITVWCRIDGQSCKSVRDVPGIDSGFFTLSSADSYYYSPYNLPRYIFYPDPTAYKMCIEVKGGSTYWFDLKPHDFLNGAYNLKSDILGTPDPNQAEPVDEEVPSGFVPMPNKLYTSGPDNPFVFPATGINRVGSGSIIAITSAARALSQGQFGQFPLYAFTDEGVWALSTNAQGGYSAVQPIARDVCTCPDSIAQLDSAVCFPSSRGLMLISGSDVRCISDPVDNAPAFRALSLPRLADAARLADIDPAPELGRSDFKKYIAACRMLYDYPGQRLVVFNPDYRYAYVYSFRSGLWSTMRSGLLYGVNSYPQAWAVERFGNGCRVVDFSLDGGNAPGLLLTRPLNFGALDAHKTVTALLHRGDFPRKAVSTLLYATRDLRHWHLLATSADHAVRNIHGTPYRYFRIAAVCHLAPGDSIRGASVDLAPRLGNLLR